MAASVASVTSTSALRAGDLALVHVELAGPGGRRTRMGTAAQALRDRRLTASERAAVAALVRAVELLRTRARLHGIDDAGAGVRLILRDADASRRGPWATVGTIAIGARNGLPARDAGLPRPGVLLTVDAAVHELAHVVQFARIAQGARPHAAILEGIADTVAILATGDDTLGEEYFQQDAAGRPTGAIRDLGEQRIARSVLGGVAKTLAEASAPGTGEHAAGGVVSAAFRHVRTRLGRDRAEQLVWAVIRDSRAWSAGGSWRALVDSMRRAARQAWPADAAAEAAVEGALQLTGLAAAA